MITPVRRGAALALPPLCCTWLIPFGKVPYELGATTLLSSMGVWPRTTPVRSTSGALVAEASREMCRSEVSRNAFDVGAPRGVLDAEASRCVLAEVPRGVLDAEGFRCVLAEAPLALLGAEAPRCVLAEASCRVLDAEASRCVLAEASRGVLDAGASRDAGSINVGGNVDDAGTSSPAHRMHIGVIDMCAKGELSICVPKTSYGYVCQRRVSDTCAKGELSIFMPKSSYRYVCQRRVIYMCAKGELSIRVPKVS